GRGRERTRADGHAVGRDGRDPAAFADDLRRHPAWRGRLDPGRCRGRRAGGDAGRRRGRSRRPSTRPGRAVHPASGLPGAPFERDRRPADADGRAGVYDSPLRVLELRLLVARPDQPGQGGLEGAAFRADPRRRPGIYPASRGAADGQLSVTEFGRIELSTGVTLNVALAGDSAKPAVILLHGFPESHRTWREVAPRIEHDHYIVMPDQRGFAGSDLPQDVGAYKTDT